MVKIRLTRGGAKKRPFYHIIVTDSRAARDGRNIERLGFYNPVAAGAEKRVEMDTERVRHWIGQGAQMSEKVADLFKQTLKAGAQPEAKASAAKQDAVEQDAVEQPAVEQHAVEQHAVQQPAVEQPAAEQSAAAAG